MTPFTPLDFLKLDVLNNISKENIIDTTGLGRCIMSTSRAFMVLRRIAEAE